jgi:hypothetical protein
MSAVKRKRPVKKTSEKSSVVQLVPQEHGGALQQGNPGNAGGGRPKDVVRQKLALLAQGKGITFLDNTLAGKIEVQLVGKCQHCQKENEKPQGEAFGEFFASVLEKVQTSVDQRLKANEQALKYGVGTKDELPDVKDDPRVVAFVEKFKSVLKRNVGTAVYDTIIQELAIEVVND